MGGNGVNCGNFWMLDGKMGNLGAEKVKKHGFDWQQGYGGGGVHWRKLPRNNGGKWGKMGKPNQSTLAPHFLLFAPTSPHNTPFPPISSHIPLISPHFLPYPPHFPPFSPIFPHFPPFFLILGTLRVRCWYITTHLVRVFLRPALEGHTDIQVGMQRPLPRKKKTLPLPAFWPPPDLVCHQIQSGSVYHVKPAHVGFLCLAEKHVWLVFIVYGAQTSRDTRVESESTALLARHFTAAIFTRTSISRPLPPIFVAVHF